MGKQQDDLVDCIDAAQAAALGTIPWDQLLERIAIVFPGTKISLASEQPAPRRNIGLVPYGYDRSLVDDYANHYSRINPWTPYWKNIRPFTAALSDEILPSHMFEATGFYEFIARAGEAESAAGIKLFEGVDEFGLLNIHYGKRSAARYNQTVPKFLNALAPYLKTAVQLSGHIAAASDPVTTLEKLVTQFPSPAFLLDGEGTVRESSQSARDLIRDGLDARLRDERLWIEEDVARDRLVSLLTNRRPGISPTTDDRHSSWRLLEFLSGPFDRRLAWLPPTRKWILAVFEPSRTRPLLHERASDFGLTRQETRVAVALVDGLRVDTIADNLGISSSTVRQHLKSAFAKTKAHRQAELIARLLNP